MFNAVPSPDGRTLITGMLCFLNVGDTRIEDGFSAFQRNLSPGGARAPMPLFDPGTSYAVVPRGVADLYPDFTLYLFLRRHELRQL